jgi:hypothetical protein
MPLDVHQLFVPLCVCVCGRCLREWSLHSVSLCGIFFCDGMSSLLAKVTLV